MGGLRAFALMAALLAAGCGRARYHTLDDADAGSDGDADAPDDAPFDRDARSDADSAPPDVAIDADADAGDPCAPRFRWPITLHPPPLTADVPRAVIGVLIPDSTELASHAQGDRITFFMGDGRKVAFDIEVFDPLTGQLVAWLRLPSMRDGGDTIELRYGGDCPNDNDPTSVWEDYAMVAHLDGEPTAPPPQWRESTGIHHGVSLPGLAPSEIDGIAGRAVLCDGIDDEIDFGAPGALAQPSASFSLSLWVRRDATVGAFDIPFWNGGSSETYPGYDIELVAASWETGIHDGTDSSRIVLGTDAMLATGFANLVLVVDRETATMRSYANGIFVDSLNIAAIGALDGTFAARIGRGEDEYPFRGAIDELRIYRGVMTPDRVAVEHACLRSPSSFLELGTEQPL